MQYESVVSHPLGLYIHVPFCQHKCGYCDFNSWAEEDSQVIQQWIDCITEQIAFWGPYLKKDKRVFDSVFFGGGTPNILKNDQLQLVFTALQKHFSFTSKCEWSIEANPEFINKTQIDFLNSSPVNRLSIGIQSFQNKQLQRLERKADRLQNQKALGLVSESWEGDFSFDLMYALPEQNVEALLEDLELAMDFPADHISLYQLTLTTLKSQNWQQGDEKTRLQMHNLAEEFLAQEGYAKYEVSNFCKANKESQHNLKYWQLQPFLALGPGARGLLPWQANASDLRPSRFGVHQNQPNSFNLWKEGATKLSYEFDKFLRPRSHSDHVKELLMMNMRLKSGVALNRLSALGIQVDEIILDYQALGYLRREPGRFALSQRAEVILDTLILQIFDRLQPQLQKGALDSSLYDPIFA